MFREYEDMREPGRVDVNGEEWWACDPYPTWFRWDGDKLRTNHARFADVPLPRYHPSVKDPDECYGHDNHLASCDRIIKVRWSGVRCDCSARWFCL